MKKFILGYFTFVMLFFVASLFLNKSEARAANLTPGYTPTNLQTMSAAQFVQAFTSATIEDISRNDLQDAVISLTKMDVDSVGSSQVINLSLVGGASGDIATNTLTTANIKIATFTGREFGSTVTIPTGAWDWTSNVVLNFSTNQIASSAIAGTNASPGSAVAGYVVKAGTNGLISNTFLSFEKGGATLTTNITCAASYTTLCSFTTTNTSGTIFIWAQASRKLVGSGDLLPWGIDIYNGSSQVSSAAMDDIGGDNEISTLNTHFVGNLSGATTFSLRGIIASASDDFFCGGTTNTTSDTDNILYNPTKINYVIIP